MITVQLVVHMVNC